MADITRSLILKEKQSTDLPVSASLCSHEFPLGGSSLQHVGDGDAGVSIGEVGIVAAPGHGDTEAVVGNPLEGDVVELPGNPLSAL